LEDENAALERRSPRLPRDHHVAGRVGLLIAGLFHAVFNTTNNTFGQELIPGDAVGTGFYLASGVVMIAAIVIAVKTKGQLSYNAYATARSAPAQTRAVLGRGPR
jgi:cytochrome bd-type quinol oxidase subunit 2